MGSSTVHHTSPHRCRQRLSNRVATVAAAASLLLSAVLLAPLSAFSAGPIPTGYTGYDISWPQCSPAGSATTRTPPGQAQFAIVGVSDGHSFSTNPCDGAQFTWAKGLAAPPTVYFLVNVPNSTETQSEQTMGTTGPAGNCPAPPADMYCNDYNFGWNNAQWEMQHAASAGVSSQVWWLDVETGSCWDWACDNSYDTANNYRVIQGNLDYLHSQGVTAGVYSTAYQYGLITGGNYNPGFPVWVADYNGGDPSQDCGPSAKAFGGGQVWQVQSAPVTLSDGNRYDPDYSCPSPHGYWLGASDGGIFTFGNAPFYGSEGGTKLNRPIVGMAAPPQGGGYWMVASDGGIFSFGPNAHFYGSTGNIKLNQPVVGMASTVTDNGYWLVATDGGIFSFGPDAHFFGSTGNIKLNQPVVGMAPTPSGAGYWMVASDGGIFAFGDARFFGSTGNIRLNKPIVAMASTSDGGGYWMVASDGGVFTFGDAAFYGSGGSMHLASPVVSMAATPDGLGYWMTTAAGDVLSFGDALAYGSLHGKTLAAPIQGMAATP